MNPRRSHRWLLRCAILQVAGWALPAAAQTKPETAAPAVSVNVEVANPVAAAPAPAVPVTAAEGAAGKAKSKLKPADIVKPLVAAPLSPRFLQVRARIAALLAVRSVPPPTPDPRLNPFRGFGGSVVSGAAMGDGAPLGPITGVPGQPATTTQATGAEGEIEPVGGTNSLALLQQAVGNIKIKGTVRMGNRVRLSLNTGPGKDGIYGEGDVVNILIGNEAVPVRIRTVTRNSVTLTLGDSELVLKF